MSIDFGALAGTVTKDLEAVGKELHDSAAADLDAFRTALPGITAAAHSHIDEMASAMISWGEAHLAKLRSTFGLPDPATGQPTPIVPPTQSAVSSTPDASSSSASPTAASSPSVPASSPETSGSTSVDPTLAPSTTEGTSAPSSTEGTSAPSSDASSATPTDTPAASA